MRSLTMRWSIFCWGSAPAAARFEALAFGGAFPRDAMLEDARLVRRVAPEALERVELARLLLEDVEHDVAVIHQDPVRALHALDRLRGAELLGDGVGDGAGLPVRSGGGQDEVVGHRRQIDQVEDEDGGSLAVERRGETLSDLVL